ncbi:MULTISPECIES: hypothetical protein [unclassified Streptomyces]|uniref:hypothetical protein n=1 Tax=unclassified Streptomyces TaxID=2593676 RepID=UPI00278C6C97|nr:MULTISPECIES: hypothetical protein [unclassified Streptomyces]
MTHGSGSGFEGELKTREAPQQALTARFRGQGRERVVLDRRRAARQARRVCAGICGLIALVAVVVTGIRLGQGSGAGAWTVLYLAGGVVSGCGVVLARFGRTRWALAAMCVGAGVATLGDGPMFG